jgi:nucleoside 2-deoxyribosyltransferase
MRVYVAGPWVDRESAKEFAARLEARGHVITHPWWLYEGENQDNEPKEFLQQCAKQDVEGVRTADAIIVLNTFKSEGKAVEQGLAIAFEKPIICMTPGEKPSSNVFHYLTSFYNHVTSPEAAINALENDYK